MRRRNKQVIVRMDDREHAHLVRQAEIAGLKVAPFVRSLIMGVQLRPRPPDTYTALLRELSAIGNNINQIAHVANTDKQVPQEVFAQIGKLQMVIWKKVKGL